MIQQKIRIDDNPVCLAGSQVLRDFGAGFDGAIFLKDATFLKDGVSFSVLVCLYCFACLFDAGHDGASGNCVILVTLKSIVAVLGSFFVGQILDPARYSNKEAGTEQRIVQVLKGRTGKSDVQSCKVGFYRNRMLYSAVVFFFFTASTNIFVHCSPVLLRRSSIGCSIWLKPFMKAPPELKPKASASGNFCSDVTTL